MHFLFVLGVFYFLPTVIAALRRTHNTGLIFVLNLFTGWTVVGWIAALIWAAFSAPKYVYVYPVQQNYRQY